MGRSDQAPADHDDNDDDDSHRNQWWRRWEESMMSRARGRSHLISMIVMTITIMMTMIT